MTKKVMHKGKNNLEKLFSGKNKPLT